MEFILSYMYRGRQAKSVTELSKKAFGCVSILGTLLFIFHQQIIISQIMSYQ